MGRGALWGTLTGGGFPPYIPMGALKGDSQPHIAKGVLKKGVPMGVPMGVLKGGSPPRCPYEGP